MTSRIEPPATVEHRTRVRFAVVAMAILLGMVTYLDRACMGSADMKDPMMADLHLTETELGYSQTAFALSYGLFAIASAWWADRIGTRTMLTAVVFAWSVFTIATGAAQGLMSLIFIRFLFGAGEAGAWPAITRTLSRWIPYRERGTAQGIVWIGAHITAGLTPLLIHEMLHGFSWPGVFVMSWRGVFVTFGLVGLAWAAVWYLWFRDEPSQHRQVNEAELAHIMAGRKPTAAEERPRGWVFWRRLLTHRNVIALCLMYLPNSFIFYFCITWFDKYLQKGRGMTGRELAIFTGLPLLLSIAGDLFGGMATDWAVRRFGPRYGRAGVGFIAYITTGATVLLAAFVTDARLAATLFALGTAANMFILGAAWGTCQDIGGGHAGVVSATMNTAGQAGAMTCPLLVIYMKDHFGWESALVLIGVSFLVTSFTWCFIDPTKKVFD
jgi:MFS transporter, ACS family, glucarate transporter